MEKSKAWRWVRLLYYCTLHSFLATFCCCIKKKLVQMKMHKFNLSHFLPVSVSSNVIAKYFVYVCNCKLLLVDFNFSTSFNSYRRIYRIFLIFRYLLSERLNRKLFYHTYKNVGPWTTLPHYYYAISGQIHSCNQITVHILFLMIIKRLISKVKCPIFH